MKQAANWSVTDDDAHTVRIKDLGPWGKHKSVFTDAASVYSQILENGILNGRRLVCTDPIHTFEIGPEGPIEDCHSAAGNLAENAPAA